MARPQIAMAHTASLICEGVFERFPEAQVPVHRARHVLGAGHDVAHGRRLEGVARLHAVGEEAAERVPPRPHPVRQPADGAAADPLRSATPFWRWLHADEILVYASDYPHWDWDDPKTVLPGIDEGAAAAHLRRHRLRVVRPQRQPPDRARDSTARDAAATLSPAARSLPPGASAGSCRLGGRGGIGVFNVGGTLPRAEEPLPAQGRTAVRGAPAPARGGGCRVSGSSSSASGEILKCAWHNWEFDLKTGVALYDPALRVKTYRVTVEQDEVVLYLE